MKKSNYTPKDQSKDSKINYAKKLFKALKKDYPISRRMAATEIGYIDQTYMVTQIVSDWLKTGKAQVVKRIKCSRSGRFVQGITTNEKLFKESKSNQLKLFK